ncbi:hypothetical protein H5T51_04010 [Candidatus Bathyarchaeota archaeon]|nr:hypothetical protein [Candidatus Bathyarchaeota archaeon]
MRAVFCSECKNFEDRIEVDNMVFCARGHRPRGACPEFTKRDEDAKETVLKNHFCFQCKNFEDRTWIDGTVYCAKGHRPRVACPEFRFRRDDIFYNYLYWAFLYYRGETTEGKEYLEERTSQKLQGEKLAYACLLDYFDLSLEDSNFYRCWEKARKIYKDKMPRIAKVLDALLQRFKTESKGARFREVFSDLISGKTPEAVAEEILKGVYDRRIEKAWIMK